MIEVACTPDCSFLGEGQKYQSLKKFVHQIIQHRDPVRAQRYYATVTRLGHVLVGLERCIVEFQRELTTLSDRHVEDALKLLSEDYRTEEKGILYEHSHTDPMVESLAASIKKFFETAREGVDQSPPLKPSDIVESLEAAKLDVEFHLEKSADSLSYLSFISRNHPDLAGSKEKRLIKL